MESDFPFASVFEHNSDSSNDPEGMELSDVDPDEVDSPEDSDHEHPDEVVMQGEATLLELFPLAQVFEDSDSSSDSEGKELSDVDSDELGPREDSDQEHPDKVGNDQEDPDELNPDKFKSKNPDEVGPHKDFDREHLDKVARDQDDPDEVNSDKFNPKNVDLDAVVTLAAASFTTKTSSPQALSLRSSCLNELGRPLTNGPHAALHDRTVAVLDALAYISVNDSSPAVAIGLTMKPLQLVVATNEEFPRTTIVEHLDTICSALKTLSDTKFCASSDQNPLSDANLREISPALDFYDRNLESSYDNLFLQVYKYSLDRLQTKHKKRWEVLEAFSSQLIVWREREIQGQEIRCDQVEPHKKFFNSLNSFRFSGLCLRDCLIRFSKSGWKMDRTEVNTLRSSWQKILAHAEYILNLKVGEITVCDYWAMKVFLGQRRGIKEKPLQLRRAIEKLVAFHRHVFTLLRFANSKRMRPSFFSSKITVISGEKKHPLTLSWPSNKPEWRDLLGSIYRKHELTIESGPVVKKAERRMTCRATKRRVAAIIHCECAMVAYLYRYAVFQAFSYIGVSKLSCKACHYWIEAFNRTMSTTFRTRGCHDKWYGGWARPGLGEADNQSKVDAEFLAFVEGELCELGKRMARISGASDSSGSSEPMVPTPHLGYQEGDEAEYQRQYGRLF